MIVESSDEINLKQTKTLNLEIAKTLNADNKQYLILKESENGVPVPTGYDLNNKSEKYLIINGAYWRILSKTQRDVFLSVTRVTKKSIGAENMNPEEIRNKLKETMLRASKAASEFFAAFDDCMMALNEFSGEPTENTTPQSTKQESTAPQKPNTLKVGGVSSPAPDIKDPDWPVAINPNLIVRENDKVEKKFRALQISSLVGEKGDKAILDFGCGDGFVSKELSKKALSVVGFDIKQHPEWEELKQDIFNLKFTSDFDELGSQQFDLIILYDVLDHLVGRDPVELLKSLSGMLSPHGKIFIRCHPWTSKHGGHVYETINKAYIHLAYTADELLKMGVNLEPNLKINRPIATYEKWFKSANCTIFSKNITSEKVSDIVTSKYLNRIIETTWGDQAISREQAVKIMSNSFIDYFLMKQN